MLPDAHPATRPLTRCRARLPPSDPLPHAGPSAKPYVNLVPRHQRDKPRRVGTRPVWHREPGGYVHFTKDPDDAAIHIAAVRDAVAAAEVSANGESLQKG